MSSVADGDDAFSKKEEGSKRPTNSTPHNAHDPQIHDQCMPESNGNRKGWPVILVNR